MKIKFKIAALAVAATVVVPSMAQAHDDGKSVVLDVRGNAVTTLRGDCVVHDFIDPKASICDGSKSVEEITIIDEVVIPNVVYFNLGSSSLNSRGQKVIDEVAKGLDKLGTYNVNLTGHTDTSAGSAFNQRLSEKRAATVKSALAARGIESGAISTTAVGEGSNAVPTADGVVEALNRRVEISITR